MSDIDPFSGFDRDCEDIRAVIASARSQVRSAYPLCEQVLMSLLLIRKWLNLVDEKASELAHRIHQERSGPRRLHDPDASRPFAPISCSSAAPA
jgi:hypothetical protein